MVKKFECVGGGAAPCMVRSKLNKFERGGGAGASALYIGSQGQNQGPLQGHPCIKMTDIQD